MKTPVPYNPAVLEAAAMRSGEGVWQQFPALRAWIRGEKNPTLNQLAEFARKAHVPFGYLFLSRLPEAENTIPFFRKGKSKPAYDYSAELTDTIRTIQRRLDWLEEYLQQEGEAPLAFIDSLNTDIIPEKAAARIRQDLSLSLDWMKEIRGTATPLQVLGRAAEEAGIFIARSGVVENNTKATLNPEEFRGFALVGKYAAYVFLNTKAPQATHLFTLAHELVHVWLGTSAISDSAGLEVPENRMERWCDAVAAELLAPAMLLAQDWKQVQNRQQPLQELQRKYKVNPVILARRLKDVGIFSDNQYWGFINAARQGWNAESQAADRNHASGGDFYRTANNRVGKHFYNTVNRAVQSGKLLYTEAYRLTGLHGDTYKKYGEK